MSIFFLLVGLVCFADPPDWNINPSDFEFNITGFIRIKTVNNSFYNGSNTVIGVFVAGELRGVVDSTDIIYVGEAAYFPVTMYSNDQQGETLDFQIYVGSIDSSFTANETAIFDSASTLGTPVNPFILTIGWCIDVLTLGSEFSPITGEFKAGLEIRLEETIQLADIDSLILDAPLIRSNGNFNLGDNSSLIIRKDSCSGSL